MSLPAGLHLNVPMAQYISDPCQEPSANAGTLHRIITQSPLHAHHDHPQLGNGARESSPVMDGGILGHALVFGGEDSIAWIDPKDYPSKTGGIPDGWTNTAIREARDAARKEGKTPILTHKRDEAQPIADAVLKAFGECEDVQLDFASGAKEATVIWQERGIWCRCRPDWLSADRKVIVDLKMTTGSAEPSAWSRSMMGSMGYDLQAVHNLAALKADLFIFLVMEAYPPYAHSFISLSPAMLDVAQTKRDYAMQLWANCLKTNKWNGYPRRIAYAEPTTWQMNEAEIMQASA